MKKRAPYSLIFGISAILVTIILYFIILGNIFLEIINLITLLGVLVAEIIATLCAVNSKGNPRKVAAAFVAVLLIPYSIILSCLYIVNFPKGYGSYIGLYLIGLLIAGIIMYVLISFNSRRTAEENAFRDAKANILAMRKLVKMMAISEKGNKYSNLFAKVEEKLKYSNDSVILEEDEEIYNCLNKLNDTLEEADIEKELKAILGMIDKRNISASTH